MYIHIFKDDFLLLLSYRVYFENRGNRVFSSFLPLQVTNCSETGISSNRIIHRNPEATYR